MSTTWILVSDAARGRLFETAGPHDVLTEVACYTNPDLRGMAQQGGSGRTTPRTQDRVGPGRHIIEPHTSHRDKVSNAFAHLIISELAEANSRHRYDRLFLVAPPHFLGTLREQLGDKDAMHVEGELGSDLVALSGDKLLQQLSKIFPHVFHAKLARVNSS